MVIVDSKVTSVGEYMTESTPRLTSFKSFSHFVDRYSHGECALYTELREYKKPIFSLLDHVKHPVLAKQTDNIWYKGRVVSSNFDDKTCQIKLEHSKQEVKCDFHDVLPIEEGELRPHQYSASTSN